MKECIPKVFVGPYREVFDGYRNYKQSMGYKFSSSEFYYLKKLNIVLNEKYSSQISLSRNAVKEYLSSLEGLRPNTIFSIQCMLRGFGQYLVNCGYKNVYIIPKPLMASSDSDFVPYIFTQEEIRRIFESLDNMKRLGYCNYDRLFYRVIYRLLYATGMRVSEALTLRVEDIDLENDIITIRDGKDHVSRLIPFLPSLHSWLNRYKEENVRADDVYFFAHPNGETRNRMCVSNNFVRKVLPEAGINPDRGGGLNIRVHDLRHTFACHSLNKAVKQGKDPFCVLPYLSTYMGHIDIKSTEVYLRLTDDHFEEIIDANHYMYEGIGDIHD